MSAHTHIRQRMEYDLYEWSNASGFTTITHASPGLAGTDGMMVFAISGGQELAASRAIPGAALDTHNYSVGMMICASGMTMGASDSFDVMLLTGSAGTGYCGLSLQYDGGYYVSGRVRDDNGTFRTTSYYSVSSSGAHISVSVQQATGAATNDGVITLYVDNTSQQSITNVDLYNGWVPTILKAGAVFSVDSSTSGSLQIDEVVVDHGSQQIPMPWSGTETVYYVDTTKAPGGNGTASATAWDAASRVRTAFLNGEIGPGACILFHRGQTFGTSSAHQLRMRNILTPAMDAGVSLGAYGDGASPILNMTAAGFATIQIDDNSCDYVTIRNLDITNNNNNFGIFSQGDETSGYNRGIFVDNCRFFNDYAGGLQFRRTGHFRIRDSQFESASFEGMYLGNSGDNTDRLYMGFIQGNTGCHLGRDFFDTKAGADLIVAASNYCDSVVQLQSDGAYSVRGRDIWVIGNIAERMGGSGATGASTRVGVYHPNPGIAASNGMQTRAWYNLIRGQDLGAGTELGIQLGGSLTTVFHNTVVDCATAGIDHNVLVGDGSSAINNITYSNGVGMRVSACTTEEIPDADYNIPYSNGSAWSIDGANYTLAQVQANHSIETSSSAVDPSFVETASYSINNTSPAWAAGYQITPAQSSSPNIGWWQTPGRSAWWSLATGFEAGLSEFTETGSGLSVSSASVYAGTVALAVSIAAETSYLTWNPSASLRRSFVRPYVNLDAVDLDDGDEIDFIAIEGTNGSTLATVSIARNSGSNYLRMSGYSACGLIHRTSRRAVPASGWFYLEVCAQVSRSKADIGPDGWYWLAINGADQEEFWSVDNAALTSVSAVKIGQLTTTSSSGIIYVDNFVVDEIVPIWDATFTQTGGAFPAGIDLGTAVGNVTLTTAGSEIFPAGVDSIFDLGVPSISTVQPAPYGALKAQYDSAINLVAEYSASVAMIAQYNI